MESKTHKELKKRIAKKYNSKGYKTELEKQIDGLRVDVYAENEDECIAIEVGALHGSQRIEKLKKSVDKVLHLTQLDKPKVRSNHFRTINVKPDTKKRLQKLKIEEEYKNMDQLVKEQVFGDEIDEEG